MQTTASRAPRPAPPPVAARAPAAAALALACAALSACPGCYRHVVGAKGPSASTQELHEANIQRGESIWDNEPVRIERDDEPRAPAQPRTEPPEG
jgi:hypothetical protein